MRMTALLSSVSPSKSLKLKVVLESLTQLLRQLNIFSKCLLSVTRVTETSVWKWLPRKSELQLELELEFWISCVSL